MLSASDTPLGGGQRDVTELGDLGQPLALASPQQERAPLLVRELLEELALVLGAPRLRVGAGLGLLGVATVKAVVVDLADVPPIWRVASVLCLGLLMLGVAVVYAKASDTFLERGGPKS